MTGGRRKTDGGDFILGEKIDAVFPLDLVCAQVRILDASERETGIGSDKIIKI